jgi:hypothetical protein
MSQIIQKASHLGCRTTRFNKKILLSTHVVYLCVLYGSQNKQRLFPSTALTDWFVYPRRIMFSARYDLNLYIFVYLMLLLLYQRLIKAVLHFVFCYLDKYISFFSTSWAVLFINFCLIYWPVFFWWVDSGNVYYRGGNSVLFLFWVFFTAIDFFQVPFTINCHLHKI